MIKFLKALQEEFRSAKKPQGQKGVVGTITEAFKRGLRKGSKPKKKTCTPRR